MWRIKLRILALFLVLAIPLGVPDSHQDASAGTYSPCVVPSTVGGAVKPNVLFVMDYSGSMQGPAYYPAADHFHYYTTGYSDCRYGTSKVIHYYDGDACDPEPVNGFYSRWKDYAGYFAINKYYKYNTSGYFEVSATKPPGANAFAVDKIRIYKVVQEGLEAYEAQVWTQTSFQNQLQVDDPVCFENVTKKEFLTKSSWKVTYINTATYKDFIIHLKLNKTYVEDPIDGTPDSGTVFKRVAGALQNGYSPGTTTPRYTPVSGNVINYLSASRYDNALMALIGGRGDISGDIATLKPLSGRAHLAETSEFRCTTHVYPSTSSTTDYSSGFILDKTTRLSVTTQNATGTISTSSPRSAHAACSCTRSCSNKGSCSSCQQKSDACSSTNKTRAEVWTFTLGETGNTRVYITMRPDGSSLCPYLKLYSGSTPSGTPLLCDSSSTSSYARIDTSLAPGTYSIEATVYSSPTTLGAYSLESNVGLKEHPTLNTNTIRRNEWLGNVSDLWCKLRKPKSERSGIIQQNMAKVRFGFMMFRGSPGENTCGKIMVPLHNTDVNVLVDAFQGKANTTYGITYNDQDEGVFPYSGTPTGEALTQAQYYLQQSGSMASWNTAFKGTGAVDPYKGLDYRGTYVAVPCRKSFVVLISDGVWSSHMNASGVVDPVEPAYTMHHSDLRSDMAGDQLADVYTIYAFGEEVPGRNSMKEVAMYGGFTDKDANLWPYPRSGYPTYVTGSGSIEDRSCNLRWPLIECCKCPTLADVQGSTCGWKGSISECGACNSTTNSCLASLCLYPNDTYRSSTSCSGCECSACGQYNETDNGQCQEWASKTYENTSYTRSGVTCTFRTLHGVPTNYFQASDGAEIEDALTAVLAKAAQQTGAAGSVATVSQRYQGEDLVVRAAFDAADPDRIGGYKWYGHLETYLPFQVGGEYQYDFDMPCNANKVFCKDMPGEDPGTCHTPPTCWDAGEMLKTLYESSTGDTTRKIFTLRYDWNAGKTALVPYKWQFEDFPTWSGISADTDGKNKWKQLLNTSTDSDTENLVYWIRGSGVSTLRDREGNILGDIVYSTPVVVSSAPSMGMVPFEDPDYQEFLIYRQSWIEAQKKTNKPGSTPTTVQKLKKMVYVGGNDGMLHAFVLGVWDWDNQVWIYTPGTGTGQDPDIGKELWSYLPSNLLSQMKCLAEKADSTKEYAVDTGCNHRYMVDLSPKSFQVYITSSDCKTDVDRDGSYSFTPAGKDYNTDTSGDGKCWRTILVGGERGGGDQYFAIDITNPDQPKLLWEISMIKDLVEFQVTSSATQFRKPPLITSDQFYEQLKVLPMAWSRAEVGRLTLPAGTGYKFHVGDPLSETLSNWPPTAGTTISNTPAQGIFPYTGDRHLVFVGGGFRIFQDTLTAVNGVSLPSTVPKTTLDVMRKPRLLAIDVETGQNVFRYLWPYMIARTEYELSSYTPRAFDPPSRGSSPSYYVPYAMGDPWLVDVWDLYQCERPRSDSHFPGCKDGSTGTPDVGSDGYVDHLYIGDLNGNFYAVKFVGFRENPTGTPGIWVDVRPTKGLDETTYHSTWLWSRFRSRGTPVSTQPSVSLDRWDPNYLRVIVGTGKYDDIPGEPDDKTDPAKMALYNMKDPIMKDPFTLDGSGNPSDITPDASKILSGTGISLCLNMRCLSTSTFFNLPSRCTYFGGAKYSDSHDTSKCQWAKSCTTDATSGTRSCVPDCCQSADSTCAGTLCWNCIYDVTKPTSEGAPGERFTTKPLIAGGLVFITSYVPASDPCVPQGQGYLYAFEYTCNPFPDSFQPFLPADSPVSIYGTTSTEYMIGQVVNLGAGVPSAPVLDSSGKKLIIQMSDGKIKTIDVNLLIKHVQVKGWRERTN